MVVYFWTATNRRLPGVSWSIFAPPFIAPKELDEPGIHASHFTRKSLYEPHFNFNHTLGTGARNDEGAPIDRVLLTSAVELMPGIESRVTPGLCTDLTSAIG